MSVSFHFPSSSPRLPGAGIAQTSVLFSLEPMAPHRHLKLSASLDGIVARPPSPLGIPGHPPSPMPALWRFLSLSMEPSPWWSGSPSRGISFSLSIFFCARVKGVAIPETEPLLLPLFLTLRRQALPGSWEMGQVVSGPPPATAVFDVNSFSLFSLLMSNSAPGDF